MIAPQPLPPLVSRDAQCDPVFRAELFQLRHDAIGDDGDTFGVEAVHHCLEQLELVLDGVGEEVRVDEDGVGRDEGGVVLEEEGRGDLGAMETSGSDCVGETEQVHFADDFIAFGFSLAFYFAFCLVFLSGERCQNNRSNADTRKVVLPRRRDIQSSIALSNDSLNLILLNASHYR